MGQIVAQHHDAGQRQFMGEYKLIGLDQTESTIVRRALLPWSKDHEQTIRPLLVALVQCQSPSTIRILEPRWETNVYPLYYWAHREVGSRRLYDHILEMLPKLFSIPSASLPKEQLRANVKSAVNSEIDILVEDADYFAFIEVKIDTALQKGKFRTIGGVHQMVRQYMQGRILEKLTGKKFALAVVCANNAKKMMIDLNYTEQALLSLVGDVRTTLEISDLAWAALTQ